MKNLDYRALKENWDRLKKHPENRTPEIVPALNEAVKVERDYLHGVQSSVREQLDILRKTRGQRNVGEVKIPAHLQAPLIVDVSGVEVRSSALPIHGSKE